jgi:hypothetical protein
MALRQCYPYLQRNTSTYKVDTSTIGGKKEKGLCFNCDSKYSKRHKCGEKKLFYIDCEEEEEEEQQQEPYQDENVEAISSEELNPMISCNALAGISSPQTLKIEV